MIPDSVSTDAPVVRKRRVMIDALAGVDAVRKSIHKLHDILDDLRYQIAWMGMQPVSGAMMDAKGRLIDPRSQQVPMEPVFLLAAEGLEKIGHPFWIKAHAEEAAAMAKAAGAALPDEMSDERRRDHP